MTAFFAVGVEPMAQAPGPAQFSPAFIEAVQQASREGQYLVEISAYKGGEARSGGIAGMAEISLADFPRNAGVDVGQVELDYADSHWVGAPVLVNTYTFDFMGSLPAGATLTRASGGYYTAADGTMTWFASDAARVGDRGLLVEDAATNLVQRSAEFDNVYWTKAEATITADDAISPDGTQNADKVLASDDTDLFYRTGLVLSASSTYVQSIFFKNTSSPKSRLGVYDNNASKARAAADFIWNGSIPSFSAGSESGFVSAAVEDYGGGWWRLSMVFTTAAVVTTHYSLFYPNYEGIPSQYLHAWGAQLELGAAVSSYIPTTAAAVTRAADILTLDVRDGDYDIDFVRESGNESLTAITVPSAGYIAPNSASPLQSVEMRGYEGTSIDGAKANAWYEGRVPLPLLMERTMPLLPEEERRALRQFGLLEIGNADGALDAILQSYAVDGRRVRVLFGPKGGAYSDFSVVADVLGTGWAGDSLLVRLGLRDQSYSLDLPLQTDLYLGTGGAEGTSEIKGKPKPLLFGRCRNVAPVLIDPTNLIYQVHDGVIFAVDDVFDRGAVLTDSLDDAANYAALVALSVAAGEFATAKAVGLFKLGALPDGLVTCDVRGDADPDYQNTLDVICLRILRDRALLSGRWINTATFAGAAAMAGEIGIYISQNETPSTAQVLSMLMAAVGGWWGAGRDGRIRAGRLTKPEDRSPNLYLDIYKILTLEPEDAPVPRWRQRVGYQPNWTPQRGEDLATSVDAARRQFLTEPTRVVQSADSTVRVRHLQALDPQPLPTLYESSTAALTLATYLLALHSPDRKIYRVTVGRLAYLVDLQSVVRVTWPRFGLNQGKNFAVIGIREDAQRNETTLRLWG